jgi:hypothetical protein
MTIGYVSDPAQFWGAGWEVGLDSMATPSVAVSLTADFHYNGFSIGFGKGIGFDIHGFKTYTGKYTCGGE